MMPKELLLTLVADYLELEAMLAAFPGARSADEYAYMRAAAIVWSRALERHAYEVEVDLDAWPGWQAPATSIAVFARCLGDQLEDPRRAGLQPGAITRARAGVYATCQALNSLATTDW